MVTLLFEDSIIVLKQGFAFHVGDNMLNLAQESGWQTIWKADNEQHAKRMLAALKRVLENAQPNANRVIDIPQIAQATKEHA